MNATLHLSPWSLGHKELQLQRNTADQLITRCVRSAHLISSRSLEGKPYFRVILIREKGGSYLSAIAFSHLVLHIIHVSLYKKPTPLFFQSASPSPSMVMPGRAFHPNLEHTQLRCGCNTNQEKKKDAVKRI